METDLWVLEFFKSDHFQYPFPPKIRPKSAIFGYFGHFFNIQSVQKVLSFLDIALKFCTDLRQ